MLCTKIRDKSKQKKEQIGNVLLNIETKLNCVLCSTKVSFLQTKMHVAECNSAMINYFVITSDETEEVAESGEGDAEGAVTYTISTDVHFSSSKISR